MEESKLSSNFICPPTLTYLIMPIYQLSRSSILLLLMVLLSCQKDGFLPSAYFTVFPSFGDSRTVFHFDATRSQDNETVGGGLLVRWDWEGDSIWDTPFSLEKEAVRRFKDPGWYYITMQVKDHSGNTALYRDTFNVWSSFPETGELTDDRDGQIYSTVKFKDQWLMSENLRYGAWIQDSVMPTQGTGPEFFLYNNNGENLKYGGLYTWDECMNYKEVVGGQGICPEGWHVPTFKEWNDLIGFELYYDQSHNYFAYVNAVPLNIAYYYGKDSPSGLELLFYGYGELPYPSEGNEIRNKGMDESVGYWTSSPLWLSYYGDKTVQNCLNLQLSKYLYGVKPSHVRFDPLLGNQQPALALNYVRCFKN